MNRAERLKQDGFTGEEPILFYKPRSTYGVFSNFSRHGIWLPNPHDANSTITCYPTGEHRFQAMKAMGEFDHEFVLNAPNPWKAKERGGPKGIELREGWGNDYGDLCWYVMLEITIAKAIQHSDVLRMLRKTGNLPIYEDSPTDDIWGWRFEADYRGKNLLGRCWMVTRDILGLTE